jgi:hypothetical protein
VRLAKGSVVSLATAPAHYDLSKRKVNRRRRQTSGGRPLPLPPDNYCLFNGILYRLRTACQGKARPACGHDRKVVSPELGSLRY